MDAIDNPDHGRQVYNGDGIRVVNAPFVQSKAVNDASVSPAGGPNFPATEDAEVNPVPS